MTCKQVVDFLMDYLNGELPAEQHQVFQAHLSICPSCVNYMHTYEETVRLGRMACSEESRDAIAENIPEDLVRAILAARDTQQGETRIV